MLGNWRTIQQMNEEWLWWVSHAWYSKPVHRLKQLWTSTSTSPGPAHGSLWWKEGKSDPQWERCTTRAIYQPAGKDGLESIWRCISGEHFTECNHTGHPHAKCSKANTFLEMLQTDTSVTFLLYVLEKGNFMSKPPSLALAVLYIDVQGSSYRIAKKQQLKSAGISGQWWVTSSEDQTKPWQKKKTAKQ